MEERAKRKLFFLAAASAVIAAFLLAGVPRLYSLVHFSSYLNLRTGNVLTVCRIPGMTLCRRETPSVLSPRLSGYVLHPHPEWLHIREKHGFGRLYLKKGRCFAELYFLFLEKEEKGGAPSGAELSAVLSKYGVGTAELPERETAVSELHDGVFLPVDVNRVRDSQIDQDGNQKGAAVTDQGQGQSRDRRQADAHADVDDGVEKNDCRDSDAEITPEIIRRQQRRPENRE